MEIGQVQTMTSAIKVPISTHKLSYYVRSFLQLMLDPYIPWAQSIFAAWILSPEHI